MTQKEYMLIAFKAGRRFMDSTVWELTRRQVSAPSFKRIVHELRQAGEPIRDREMQPENGGHPYKEYYYDKTAVVAETPLLTTCRERLAEYIEKARPECTETAKIKEQIKKLEEAI